MWWELLALKMLEDSNSSQPQPTLPVYRDVRIFSPTTSGGSQFHITHPAKHNL